MALITLTGHLFDATGAPVVGAIVRFQLVNFFNNVPTVTGTNILVPTMIPLVTDSSGAYTGMLQGNDTISPINTAYQVSFTPSVVAEYIFTGAGPINLDSFPPASQVPPPMGPVPSNILTGNNTFSGIMTLTGEGSSGNVALKAATNDAIQYVSSNGVLSNDGLSWGTAKGNSDIGIAINAAIQALPFPNGGIIYLSPKSYFLSTQIVIDRPIQLISAGSSFTSMCSLEWTGGASSMIAVNGTSGAADGTTLEGFTVIQGSTATGTVGIDIYNGQYNVTLRQIGINNGGSIPFSVAGIRAGNNTSGSAVINLKLENVRISSQATGLQLLLTNEVTLLGCEIYNSATTNIQIGDSTHLTTNVSIHGGNIEQDTPTTPSIIVNNVQNFSVFGTYTETTGGPWLQVPSTATLARGLNFYGMRFEGNAIAVNIFDLRLSTATLRIDGCCSFGYPVGSNWVSASTLIAFVSLSNLIQDDSNMSYITGSGFASLEFGPGLSGTSVVVPTYLLNNLPVPDLTTVTVSTTYTATGVNQFIICNSSSAFTVTLPQGAVYAGAKFTVKNINTGTITISPASGTIDNSASFSNSTQFQSNSFVSDGTNYWIT